MRRHYLMTLCALLMAFTAVAQGNRLMIQDFEIVPDSTVTVPITFANTDASRGMQFNLTLPEGLTIENVAVTDYTKKLGLSVTYSESNGIGTIILYQMGKVCFPPDSADVVQVTFQASSQFKGGQLEIWKGRGSTMEAQTFVIEGGTTVVTVPAGSPIDLKPEREIYF